MKRVCLTPEHEKRIYKNVAAVDRLPPKSCYIDSNKRTTYATPCINWKAVTNLLNKKNKIK